MYEDMDKAFEDIRSGKIVGALYIANNFSESFEKRLHDGNDVDTNIIESSQIQVWLDLSSMIWDWLTAFPFFFIYLKKYFWRSMWHISNSCLFIFENENIS